jgi:hypothetical protein
MGRREIQNQDFRESRGSQSAEEGPQP